MVKAGPRVWHKLKYTQNARSKFRSALTLIGRWGCQSGVSGLILSLTGYSVVAVGCFALIGRESRLVVRQPWRCRESGSAAGIRLCHRTAVTSPPRLCGSPQRTFGEYIAGDLSELRHMGASANVTSLRMIVVVSQCCGHVHVSVCFLFGAGGGGGGSDRVSQC